MIKSDGTLYGFYRGVVEDNNDPLKMGRVRVRVWGLHTDKKSKSNTEGIPVDELPWADPCLPIMGGGISGFGMFGVPVNGSHIMVFFENGQYLQPRYFASLPSFPTEAPDPSKGFNDPDGKYPRRERLNEPDWPRLARGEKKDTLITTKNSLRQVNEPRSPYAARYPHNFVWVTHSGITIELDSTPGQERLHFYHPSNSYVEIDKDGRMVIRSQQDTITVAMGNKNEHVGENWTVKIIGDVNITADGTVTIQGASILLN